MGFADIFNRFYQFTLFQFLATLANTSF